MKKSLLLFTLAMTIAAWGTMAQTSWSDDFESYSPGDLIGSTSPDWTTWGGTTADDAPVSDEQAFSGSNSLKLFSESPTGGPVDVVLPLGETFTAGNFELDFMMYVESGGGAYFNFQAVEPVGTSWALEFYFDNAGGFIMSNNSGSYGDGSYPYDEWFNMNVTIDLTINLWSVFVNGDLVNSFANNINSVAMVNFYPFFNGGTAHMYVDDVAWEHGEAMLPDLDAGLGGLDMRAAGLTGQVAEVSGTIINTGLNMINSVDITWTDGTNDYMESFDGLALASLEEYSYTHPVSYEILDGTKIITATISNPNGEVDANDANNSASKAVTGYTPAAYKGVLVEEATGTWCGWCPRGSVNMAYNEEYYPDHFMGVAVHNGDPMAVTEYDNGMTGQPGFPGFPSVIVERDVIIDPSQIESYLLPRVTEAPLARLTHDVEYDAGSGEVTITVNAEFFEDISGDYRLNVAVIENGVTGTGSGYNQSNYYAGGGAGPMGGYENLPGSVPASDMVYEEVARAILGGYDGAAGSLPGDVTAGETHSYTFSYVIPSDQNPDEIHLISMLIEPSGTVDNAHKSGLEGTPSSTNVVFANHMAEVYPNPFSDELFVRLALSKAVNVDMFVYNSLGTQVAAQSYGELFGNPVLTFNPSNLASGVYFIHLKAGDKLITKKVQLVR